LKGLMMASIFFMDGLRYDSRCGTIAPAVDSSLALRQVQGRAEREDVDHGLTE